MHSPTTTVLIDERLPVWEALSRLFLDIELDEKDYHRISDLLAMSPYSIQEIEDILRFEVYPVLIWNLRSVAGVWTGFDRDWLREQIEPRVNKRPRFRMPLLQWGMIRDPWLRISSLVREKRNNNGERRGGEGPPPAESCG